MDIVIAFVIGVGLWFGLTYFFAERQRKRKLERWRMEDEINRRVEDELKRREETRHQ